MGLLKFEYDTTITMLKDIISTICAIHNLLLFLYHLLHTSVANEEKQKKKIKAFRLIYLSIFVLGYLCLFAIYTSFGSWYKMKSQLACAWIIRFGVTGYALSKTVVYLFLMERLLLIFVNTSLQFNKIQKLMVRSIVTIYMVGAIFIIMLFVDGKYENNADCYSVIPFWIIIYGVGFDILASVVMSVMFSRKLLIVNLTMVESTMTSIVNVPSESLGNSNIVSTPSLDVTHSPKNVSKTSVIGSLENVNKDDKTFKILIKSTLLTFVALISTQVQLGISGIIGLNSVLAVIDSVINGWCCVLMFAKYDHVYTKLCKKMEKCITIQCLSCYSCDYCCTLNIEKQPNMNGNRQKTISSNSTNTDTSTKEIVIQSDTELESTQTGANEYED